MSLHITDIVPRALRLLGLRLVDKTERGNLQQQQVQDLEEALKRERRRLMYLDSRLYGRPRHVAMMEERHPWLKYDPFVEGWLMVFRGKEQAASDAQRRYEALAAQYEADKRWEVGFRNIVTHLLGARSTFEISDVVELVKETRPRHAKHCGGCNGWTDNALTKLCNGNVGPPEKPRVDLKTRCTVKDGLPTVEFDREALRRASLADLLHDIARPFVLTEPSVCGVDGCKLPPGHA